VESYSVTLTNKIYQTGALIIVVLIIAVLFNETFRLFPAGENEFLSDIAQTTLILLIPSGAGVLFYLLKK